MKKTVSVLLCALLAFCCGACSKNNEKIDLPRIAPQRGVLSGNTFHSEYTDVKFTAPSDTWTFATDEELATSCNISPEEFTSKDFADLLKANATVYDVLAQSEEEKIAVLVGIENPERSAISPSSAADFVNTSLESILSTIDIENNTYKVSELQTINLCGHEYVKKTLTVETADDTAVQTYYARNMGDYLCIIVAAHTKDTTTEQVEALFS